MNLLSIKAMKQLWREMNLKQKASILVLVLIILVSVSITLNWAVTENIMSDFGDILGQNSLCSEFQEAMQNEADSFLVYTRSRTTADKEAFEKACSITQRKLAALPYDYEQIGSERFAKTWNIQNSYASYMTLRDEVTNGNEESGGYVDKLYTVYSIQNYLEKYAGELLQMTMKDGNERYQNRADFFRRMPYVVFCISLVLLAMTIMIGRNMSNNLIDKVEAEKIEMERQLESTKLQLLKNQINPHFLFNTLNLISSSAKLEKATLTEKMITALSFLFRYNLKMTAVETKLSNELDVAREYIYIQHMRFGNRLKCDIDCTADADNSIIPTFTLQPLIENAIIHGLSQKESDGIIHVQIREENQVVIISVTDNGVGIEEDQLKNMLKELQEGGNQLVGIGLTNLYKRIQNRYRDGAMNIYSKYGSGTCIQLKIPQGEGEK